MSGIYIPGMEMPTEGEYNLTLYVCSDGSAYMDVASFPVDKDRFEAVHVPPHGRLIDADALLERFEKEEKAADEHGRDFSFSFKSCGENCTEWWPVQQMLMDAPAIIPAEEGE